MTPEEERAAVVREPYAYIAHWTKRRSTASLRKSLRAAQRADCECDSSYGFECGIHRRRDELRWAIGYRELKAAQAAHLSYGEPG